MKNPIAAVIQMTSTPDVDRNLKIAEDLIKSCSKEANLAVLPEMFPIMGASPQAKVMIGESEGSGPIQDFLSMAARKYKIWIVGGTIPIKTEDANRVRSACIVYNDLGAQVARYDKTHLFDICIEKGVEEYKESETIEPGEGELVVVETPIGKLGLGVCYDIRFPIMFQALLNKGAEIISLPSAFTVKTGAAHWDVLSRARCIENTCYGLFSCQTGIHSAGKSTYGHSRIINPWGEIITSIESEVGFITAEIDLDLLKKTRVCLPIREHQRIFSINGS